MGERQTRFAGVWIRCEGQFIIGYNVRVLGEEADKKAKTFD